MPQGDIDVQIVESPITAAKIKSAADTALSNTNLSGTLTMTAFNQGRSIAVMATENLS